MDVEEPSIPPWRVKYTFTLTAFAGVLLVVVLCSFTWLIMEHQPVILTTISTSSRNRYFPQSRGSSPNTLPTHPRIYSQRQEQNNTEYRRTTIKDEKELAGWEKGKSRETRNYINPFEDTTVISGREICQNPNTTVVIICTTRSSDYFKRAVVRETWGSHNLRNVKVGFLLGLAPSPSIQKSIEKESQQHRDIIQENLVDSYMNLSLKSVALLKWYIRWCPLYSVLVKADDDSFIDVKKLVSMLDVYQPSGNVIGFVNKHFPTSRNPKGIYYVPKYIYRNDFFPDYVGGPAYFMSRDAALKLYNAALDTPIFHLEDVYITGICSQKANVTLRHFKWASFWEKSKNAKFDQKCSRHHVLCHPVREWEMPVLWERIQPPRNISLLISHSNSSDRSN